MTKFNVVPKTVETVAWQINNEEDAIAFAKENDVQTFSQEVRYTREGKKDVVFRFSRTKKQAEEATLDISCRLGFWIVLVTEPATEYRYFTDFYPEVFNKLYDVKEQLDTLT